MKYFIMVVLLDVLFLYTSLYELQMLQQNSYNEKGKFYKYLLSDIKSNYKIYLLKYLFGIALLLSDSMNFLLFSFFIVIMAVLILFSFLNYEKYNQKLPLKFTKRVFRIITFDYILFLALQLYTIFMSLPVLGGISLLFISINAFILILIVFILSPVEKLIFNGYKRKALNKLAKMNNINIIGITGSFGKTSTKMVLDTILKTKYKGFFTPASFNTPNGIIITINNEKTIFNDYFISEMGAKNVGEIKELCDIVHPKYGILTTIGEAHLESFKTIDNICKTKFELIESLPKDGVAILNKDDKYQREYKLENKCKVIWIGIDKEADVCAKNISITNKGTTFDIVFKSAKKTVTVSTILLGKKNVYNILSCAALANYLGVSDSQLITGVKNILPINHRLEIKEYKNITIIDDSFNSNPEGSKNALEVLSLMEGKKVIITPGMIEMGSKQEELNNSFGKQIADTCDLVYLIGKKQTKPIYDGLLSKKYNVDNIKVFTQFKDAYNDIIKTSGNKKISLLIENDLPDSYTEE